MKMTHQILLYLLTLDIVQSVRKRFVWIKKPWEVAVAYSGLLLLIMKRPRPDNIATAAPAVPTNGISGIT
jgi:hypothetical protein